MFYMKKLKNKILIISFLFLVVGLFSFWGLLLILLLLLAALLSALSIDCLSDFHGRVLKSLKGFSDLFTILGAQ